MQILKTTMKGKSCSLNFCNIIIGDAFAHFSHPKWSRTPIIICLLLRLDILPELKVCHVSNFIPTGMCHNEWK